MQRNKPPVRSGGSYGRKAMGRTVMGSCHDMYRTVSHVGLTCPSAARQIFLSRLCTASAATGNAQFKLQIAQGPRT